MGEVRNVFDARSPEEATRKLIQLYQDARTVADYALDFRTLPTESGWNSEAMFDMFLHRVSEKVKDELATRELPIDFDSLITLTIHIDGRLREHCFIHCFSTL